MELTPDELEALVQRGAKRALEEIGLTEKDAAKDVAEIRGLLESWRMVKRTALSTATKYVTIAIIVLLLLSFGVKAKILKLFIGG